MGNQWHLFCTWLNNMFSSVLYKQGSIYNRLIAFQNTEMRCHQDAPLVTHNLCAVCLFYWALNQAIRKIHSPLCEFTCAIGHLKGEALCRCRQFNTREIQDSLFETDMLMQWSQCDKLRLLEKSFIYPRTCCYHSNMFRAKADRVGQQLSIKKRFAGATQSVRELWS